MNNLEAYQGRIPRGVSVNLMAADQTINVQQNQGTLNIAGHNLRVNIEVNSGIVNLSGFDSQVNVDNHYRSAVYNQQAFGSSRINRPSTFLRDESINLLLIHHHPTPSITPELAQSILSSW